MYVNSERMASIVFEKLLKENQFVLLDGAMGTMLQKSGLKSGEIPEFFNITHKDTIIGIHKEYVKAGANIIYANTFGANGYKLYNKEYSVKEVITAAIANAKEAVKGTSVLVALDIGPIGQLLAPTGSLSFDDAYNYFKEEISYAVGADLIVIETMTDLGEARAALLAAKENSNLPVLCTMTFEETMRTFTGCEIPSMAITLEGLGADAIGVNCSLGPKELKPIIKKLSNYTNLPIVIKPNAGLPNPNSNTYDVTATEFAEYIKELIPYGIKVVGGCCGTTPQYIEELKNVLTAERYIQQKNNIGAVVCSASRTVFIDSPKIIGERINPTGKKLFKEALKTNNLDYILTQGITQVKAGADILDVNVGLPEINEKEMMIKTVQALSTVTDAPLQIDSTDPAVIESALRVYHGKAIVNSVNGDEESLGTILPIVKKYGASVVGLTLENNGIPPTAEGRYKIAEKIVQRGNALGIKPNDIYIDCLTLTASAQQEGAMETLKAVKAVKENLGVKTVLGVSNISFGLPNRELLNQNFLAMALSYGLDLPIINPNAEGMTGAVRSYKVLNNIDKGSNEYIAVYGNTATAPKQTAPTDITLPYAIENGLKDQSRAITIALLETKQPMEIINNYLIPALDKAGNGFEKGTLFLPQLIQSANAAQGCFEIIKQSLKADSTAQISKGKIILATVKGDIHDIGKNIVKVLLENYGYTVIDLGKDVPYESVLNTAIEQNVKLVGLSALMTTTLKSMEETIKLLRKNNVDCKIMVGGAVLTADYAKKIGADYYCKDAKESVDTAKLVLG